MRLTREVLAAASGLILTSLLAGTASARPRPPHGGRHAHTSPPRGGRHAHTSAPRARAHHRKPRRARQTVITLTYFEEKDLPTILDGVKRAHMPASAKIYVGSYGISAAVSAHVHSAGLAYAPLVEARNDRYAAGRSLGKADERTLARAHDGRLTGAIPAFDSCGSLSLADCFQWGREQGRRTRDDYRARMKAGVAIEAWQLDEIVSEVALSSSASHYLEVLRGMLEGLYEGRPALGDRPMRGITYVATNAFPIFHRSSRTLTAFFATLDKTCFRIAGEEYPDFSGSASQVAASLFQQGQATLARQGGVRASLAKKYIACMSPGYRLGVGLGGNTRGKSTADVNRWRQAYILARAREGVAGFAEYNFRFGNHAKSVVDDTIAEIANGARALKR